MSSTDEDARILGNGNVVTVRRGQYALVDFRNSLDSSEFTSNSRKPLIIRFVEEDLDENGNQIVESGDDHGGLRNNMFQILQEAVVCFVKGMDENGKVAPMFGYSSADIAKEAYDMGKMLAHCLIQGAIAPPWLFPLYKRLPSSHALKEGLRVLNAYQVFF